MDEKKSTFPPTAGSIATAGLMALPTVASVPWDPSALQGRTCAACACYFEQANPENPLQSQGFCRREPANMAEMRVMEQRRDNQGKVVTRDGKPVLQPARVIGYLFRTTKADGTCFDGWRPLGALPGERLIDTTIRGVRGELEPLMGQLPKEFRPFLAALFGISSAETQN